MNIPEHRKAIDMLDAQIVKLLNERTRHVLAIGEIKLKAGEEIYAPHRERAVLNRIDRLNEGPITNESLHAIYREIMSSALSLEKTMTIAYLGPEATFTHQAAIPVLRGVLAVPATRTVRGIPTEVPLDEDDGMPEPCALSFDNIVTMPSSFFTHRICRLGVDRLEQVCRALRVATGC